MNPIMTAHPPGAERCEPLFRATLRPNRSLSRVGFFVVMGLICGISFVAGIVFMSRGAWPVSGFFGLDAVLVYLAFRLSYRSGRLTETVELTPETLTVRRITPGGRVTSWEFHPFWLRVGMDEPAEHHSQLSLTSHGRTITIGSFLSPEERVEFAHVLRQALAGLKRSSPAA